PISSEDEVYFKKLIKSSSVKDIKISEPVDFRNFTQSFSEAHLCFDLRELNFENHHSLPIKLFYYMSSPKPVIYSRLKAINGHLNISDFGYLVDPEDSSIICRYIINYLENPELYQKHALNARRHFEKRCNWEAISQDFVDFIKMSR
ncbi:glycosyltransferase, partial [Chryseobacterium taklimakanense]|uniref:glycosyltransferase n=1 Tax=Chryseobacterium taklimakanense TaxID=536441 RepID=UPI0023F833B9